ncbi:MAG TPA: hypothetical protein VJ756_02150, partial [Terriglobales bacterium]|nr:hypothetical protein [Terriglobales bacterium]
PYALESSFLFEEVESTLKTVARRLFMGVEAHGTPHFVRVADAQWASGLAQKIRRSRRRLVDDISCAMRTREKPREII